MGSKKYTRKNRQEYFLFTIPAVTCWADYQQKIKIETMSLDIYLTQKEKTKKICSHCNSEYEAEGEELYSANITHNLGSMAEEAGIYKHLWRPEELGITTAKELIEPLRAGLQLLKDKPEHFEKFNASNGWGLYKHFVPFVEKYLNACEEYPEAQIGVSR